MTKWEYLIKNMKWSDGYKNSLEASWTPGLPNRVLSNCPRLSVSWSLVCYPSILKYLKDRSLVFSKALQEGGGHQSKKSDKNLN